MCCCFIQSLRRENKGNTLNIIGLNKIIKVFSNQCQVHSCILRYSVRPFLALMQQQQQQQQQICKYWMMALSNRENLKVVAAYLFHAQTAVGLKIHFKKQSERRTTQQEHTEAFVCLCTPYINTAFYHKLERGLSQQKPFPLSSDFFFFFF